MRRFTIFPLSQSISDRSSASSIPTNTKSPFLIDDFSWSLIVTLASDTRCMTALIGTALVVILANEDRRFTGNTFQNVSQRRRRRTECKQGGNRRGRELSP